MEKTAEQKTEFNNVANSQLLERINQYISESSRLDSFRQYVGLSSAGMCPRRIYNNYKKGYKIDAAAYRNSYRGYLMEDDMISMLEDLNFYREPAPLITIPIQDTHGIKVEGHPDGVAFNGAVIELKSYSKEKFNAVVQSKKIPMDCFSQVQAYMLYGGYRFGYVIIRCTETFEHYVHSVIPLTNVQNGIDKKIKSVCKAILDEAIPDCLCGRCRE